jgi:hypothetical protein
MRFLVSVSLLLVLTACAGHVGGGPPASSPRAAVASQDMTGRWTFSAVSGGTCAMNFSSQGPAGTIRPEGGCPGEMYKSRQFVFDENGLVIRDHTAAPLAQMRSTSANSFEGQMGAGQGVTLSR